MKPHLRDSNMVSSWSERTQFTEHDHTVLPICCWKFSHPHQGLIPEDDTVICLGCPVDRSVASYMSYMCYKKVTLSVTQNLVMKTF